MRFKKFFTGNRIGTKDEVDEDSSYQKKRTRGDKENGNGESEN